MSRNDAAIFKALKQSALLIDDLLRCPYDRGTPTCRCDDIDYFRCVLDVIRGEEKVSALREFPRKPKPQEIQP